MKVITIMLGFCIVSSYAQSATPLRTILEAGFQKVKSIADADSVNIGNLTYASTSSSHIPKNQPDIIINEAEIDYYTRGWNVLFIMFFCRFVLCHELAHHVQNSIIKMGTFFPARGETPVFIEP